MLMESDPRVGHDGYKPYRCWPAQDFPTPAVASLLPGTRILKVLPPKDGSMKLGTYGHWIAQVSGRSAFWQGVDYLPEQLYLDACNLEGFADTETGTYELETLSPSWFLTKGESRQWTVRWRLLDFPDQVQTAGDMATFLSRQTGGQAQ